jgi:hypothetical protein
MDLLVLLDGIGMMGGTLVLLRLVMGIVMVIVAREEIM